MRQSIFAGIPLVDLDTHQVLNKILGRIADLIPVRRIKLKFTCKNSPEINQN